MQNKKIADIPKTERPREKLIKYGPEKLSSSELLAIILRSGQKGENAINLAKKILRKFSSKKLPNIEFKDLVTQLGLGESKACSIIASFELSKRLLKEKKSTLILSHKEVWQEMKDIREKNKEHVVIFYLDSKNQIIKRSIISIGTVNASMVHPREVYEAAISHNATQIIIAHNHPSGDLTPSPEDIQVTKRLSEAGKILGIELLDHIIVTKDHFLSLKKENFM